MAVVIAAVASYFVADEVGFQEWFVGSFQLYLGYDQSLIIAVEFVNLEDVCSTFHQKARLVNDARLTESKELPGFFRRYFFFKLKAAQTTIS